MAWSALKTGTTVFLCTTCILKRSLYFYTKLYFRFQPNQQKNLHSQNKSIIRGPNKSIIRVTIKLNTYGQQFKMHKDILMIKYYLRESKAYGDFGSVPIFNKGRRRFFIRRTYLAGAHTKLIAITALLIERELFAIKK